MNFTPIAFLDTSFCSAGYVTRYKARLVNDEISLRRDGKDQSILKEWKSAKNLIARVRNVGGARPANIINARIVCLPPGETHPWEFPDSPGIRGWLNLIPSPGAALFSGVEAANPPVGQLVIVSQTVPFSCLNLGPVAAVWMVFDAEIPAAET